MKMSGEGALAAVLALSLVLGGCAPRGAGTAAPETPKVQQEDAGGSPELLEEAALYEVAGVTAAIPRALEERLRVEVTPEDAGEEVHSLLTVYERQSYEDGLSDYGSPMGLLFVLVRYDLAAYEQEYIAANGGSGLRFFARGGGFYYGWGVATDVQYYRSGGYDIEGGMEDWNRLMGCLEAVKADFIARNGLEPYDDGAVFDRAFLYEGEHRYLSYHNGDYSLSLTLLLSQPARQGAAGIWCVERCFDNHYGGWDITLPRTGGVTAAEYWKALQAAEDEGHRVGLLDPTAVALEWLRDYWGVTEEVPAENVQVLSGRPAGDLWGDLRRVLSQDGKLERLGSGDWTGREPETAWDSVPALYGETARVLYTVVWVQADPPAGPAGAAVRYRAEGGDELLFLEADGLLRITAEGEERWYRPAYDYEESPYHRMLGLYKALSARQG